MEEKGKKLGAIGTGSVFKRFAEGLKEAQQDEIKVKLTAVADVRPPPIIASYEYYQLPQQWAENPNPNSLPLQMREFLKEVDAVYVASPNNTHKGYILCAINEGKDVLCTKPLTESLKTAKRLQEELEKKGTSSGKGEEGKTKFMYEDHYLYQGICIHLFDELIPEANPFDESELGKIQSVKGLFIEKREASRTEPARASWLFDPEISGGGVWIDIGIHLLRILHRLGARFEMISARPRIDPGFEAEMKMTVHARLNPDPELEKSPIGWAQTPVYLVAEKEAEQARKEIDFYFEKGLVSLDFDKRRIFRFTKSQDYECLYENHTNPFKNVAEIFVKLITGQGDGRLASLSDAVKDMKVVKEVYCKAGLKDSEERWIRN